MAARATAAASPRIGAFHDGSTVLAARAAPGESFGLAEDLGSQAGLDFSGCFLDRFGHGHGLWGGYGTDRIIWARYHADGTWDQATEVLTTSAPRHHLYRRRAGVRPPLPLKGAAEDDPLPPRRTSVQPWRSHSSSAHRH